MPYIKVTTVIFAVLCGLMTVVYFLNGQRDIATDIKKNRNLIGVQRFSFIMNDTKTTQMILDARADNKVTLREYNQIQDSHGEFLEQQQRQINAEKKQKQKEVQNAQHPAAPVQ